MIIGSVVAYSIYNFVQALLQNQKTDVEEAKKSLIEADAKNAELMKKFEDAEKRAEQLQESSQRFGLLISTPYLTSCLWWLIKCYNSSFDCIGLKKSYPI